VDQMSTVKNSFPWIVRLKHDTMTFTPSYEKGYLMSMNTVEIGSDLTIQCYLL
jgi:hypothetical protein